MRAPFDIGQVEAAHKKVKLTYEQKLRELGLQDEQGAYWQDIHNPLITAHRVFTGMISSGVNVLRGTDITYSFSPYKPEAVQQWEKDMNEGRDAVTRPLKYDLEKYAIALFLQELNLTPEDVGMSAGRQTAL